MRRRYVVTSEFGRARDAVAADLRSREALLRVQSDFRQEAGSDTTLKKLHDYIRDASAVVCSIGKRSGALPPLKAAEPFVRVLPDGIANASYTQWEFFFACHFKRRLSIYIANDVYEASYGPDHPNVATGLNNLAGLLHATNQLSEAEPLFRRAIPARFVRATGHRHPNFEMFQANYVLVLGELGRTKAEIESALNPSWRTRVRPRHLGHHAGAQRRGVAGGGCCERPGAGVRRWIG